MTTVYLLEEYDESYDRTEVIACFAKYPTIENILRAITFVIPDDMIYELLDTGRLELAIPYITYYIRPMELIK